MNLFSKTLATLQTALTGIGFDHKSLEQDPQALATFIEDQKATAVQEATAAAAAQLEEASAAVTAAESAQAAATAERELFAAKFSAFEKGISAAGIKIAPDVFEKAVFSDAEAIAAASAEVEKTVKARISIHAAEQLAAAGHQSPAPEVPAIDPTKAKQPSNLTGLARTAAALK